MRQSTLRLAALGTSLGNKELFASSYIIRPLTTIGKRTKTIVDINPNHQLGVSSSYIFSYDRNKKLRLFSSLFDNNDNNKRNKGKGLLNKIVETSKSFLPKSWLSKNDEQKESQIIGRRNDDGRDIEKGISALLKNTPFPVRMLGKMIAPIVSSMAEQLSEQSRVLDDVLVEAQNMILLDSKATTALGGRSIEFGSPFSQSSSTVSINGKSTTNIKASFPVQGPVSSGIVSVSASGSKIDSLTLEVAGRYYYIDLVQKNKFSQSSSTRIGKNSKVREDDIIDAEFVEKKSN